MFNSPRHHVAGRPTESIKQYPQPEREIIIFLEIASVACGAISVAQSTRVSLPSPPPPPLLPFLVAAKGDLIERNENRKGYLGVPLL